MSGRAIGQHKRDRFTVDWATIHAHNFDSLTTASPISLADARIAFGDANIGSSTTFDTINVVSYEGGKALQWHSAANTWDNGSGKGPASFDDEPFTSWVAGHGLITKAAIQYTLEFPSNMDFGFGFKIPGLGAALTGNPPTGGAGPTDNGWSCRGMILGPGAGTFFGRQALSPAEIVGYRYYPDQPYAGEMIWTGVAVQPGEKYLIRQEYEMNTVNAGVGATDGIHRMFVDGIRRVNDSAVKWRNDAAVGVNWALLHLFRGGNSSNWAVNVTNDILWNDLRFEVKV